MNTKNRLIRSLLKAAKKHKALTYPVLALVAIISVVDYFFSWSTGAGKRVVAIVMVLVMLVSQSYFLTSSATELIDDEEAVQAQLELQEEVIDEEEEGSAAEETEPKQQEESVAEESVPVQEEPAAEPEPAQAVEDGQPTQESSVDETTPVSPTMYMAEEVIEDEADGSEEPDIYQESAGEIAEAPADAEDVFEVVEEEQANAKLANENANVYATLLCHYTTLSGSDSTLTEKKVRSNETVGDNPSEFTYRCSGDCAAYTQLLNNTADYNGEGCFKFSNEWYYDAECTRPVADQDQVYATLSTSKGDYIEIYCKRTLLKYQVMITDEQGSDASCEVNGEVINNGDSCIIDANEDGTATLEIKNLKRTGYKFVSAGNVTSSDGSSVTLTIKGNSYKQTVVTKWDPKKYTIYYSMSETGQSNGAATEYIPQEVVYDRDAEVQQFDKVYPKTGYRFCGWEIRSGETAINVNVGDSVKNLQPYFDHENTPALTLFPRYELDDVELTEYSINEYQYGVPGATHTIKAYYQQKGSPDSADNFNYQFVEPEVVEGWKATYGINVGKADGGITIGTDGPTKVPPEPLVLKLQVLDGIEREEDKIFEIRISISTTPINIVAATDRTNEKIYDGTKNVGSSFSKTLNTDKDGVVVTFEEATYESANVGNTKILLVNPMIEVPEGQDKSGYQLMKNDGDGWSVPGVITARRVYLATYSDITVIETGEATPSSSFHVKEDPAVTPSADEGFVEGEDVTALGDIVYTTFPDRTDLLREGQYRIQASAGEGSNYQVIVNSSAEGVFEVVKRTPILNTNFKITGNYQETTGWYIGAPAQVSPISEAGYDTVRVSRNRTEVMQGTEASPVDIHDSKDGTYFVQLFNSRTNAVTDWKEIDVKVDESAPQYEGFEFTVGGSKLTDGEAIAEGGLYFPGRGRALTFGSYFNNTLTVTVTYSDTVSGLNNFYYSVFGGAQQTLPFVKESDGTATVRFEIPAGVEKEIGEIIFHADDMAGNVESGGNKLSNDGVTEWGVENTAPTLEPLVVLAGDYHAVYVQNGSGIYYSKCQAVLKVKDLVSGIYDIKWNVNGEVRSERVSNLTGRQSENTFTLDINRGTFPEVSNREGRYSVYAVVADNSDNTVTTDTLEFLVDDDAPVLEVVKNYDRDWKSVGRVDFDTYDELSDIKYINVTDADGNLVEHRVESVDEIDGYRVSHCYFETPKKGTFHIIVADHAGNIATETVTLTKVSALIPDCPQLVLSPSEADGENGWYQTIPTFTIIGPEDVDNEAPATTMYQIWKDGEVDMTPAAISGSRLTETFPGEGIFHLKYWAQTASDCQCKDWDDHGAEVRIDTTNPEITFETSRGSGSTVKVSFEVTDTGSGVDPTKVLILQGTTDIPVKLEETEKGYAGSFEIKELGNYSIQGSDIAGNTAQTVSFTPMSMKIRPVKNILEDSVTLGATVIKGTAEITNATLSYRKYTDKLYREEGDTYITVDGKGNWAVSAVVDELEPATVYSYKVTATSAAGEVLEYEGLFKTLSNDKGIPVTGTARYANGSEGRITVAMYDGSVCFMALEINAGDEFIFQNVPDGNYNIVATDGEYEKSMRVLIKDGMILYPDNYIELVLSGKNTSVVVTTDETPHVSADNMDSIFKDDLLNYNAADEALVMEGGTVEFKLYATLMPVSNVSASEIAAMYAVTDRKKVVGAYLDLSLYKISTDADGKIVEQRQVTELASGANISVTIPLGELAGKPGLEVIRIHDAGSRFIGASLIDEDTNPSTYTVSTSQFSTYAVLYSLTEEATTEAAIQPATTETEQGITQKPVIQEGSMGPSTDGAIYAQSGETQQVVPRSEDPGEDDDDEDDDDEDDTDDDELQEVKKPTVTARASVGSLRSSGSAKTGDKAPIAAAGVVLILAVGGLVFLLVKKKR